MDAQKLVLEWMLSTRKVALAYFRFSKKDPEDLISAAYEGLVKAANGYNGVDPFWPYAKSFIYGKMKDYERGEDWLTRGDRKLYQEYKLVEDELRQKLGRNPTQKELEERVGRRAIEVVPFAVRPAGNFDSSTEWKWMGVPYHQDEYHEAEYSWEELDQALLLLSGPEQFVIRMRYLANPSMSNVELAELMGVDPSRTSQIHSTGLKKLREVLEGLRHPRKVQPSSGLSPAIQLGQPQAPRANTTGASNSLRPGPGPRT